MPLFIAYAQLLLALSQLGKAFGAGSGGASPPPGTSFGGADNGPGAVEKLSNALGGGGTASGLRGALTGRLGPAFTAGAGAGAPTSSPLMAPASPMAAAAPMMGTPTTAMQPTNPSSALSTPRRFAGGLDAALDRDDEETLEAMRALRPFGTRY